MKVFHKVNVSNRENVLQRTDRTEILEQTEPGTAFSEHLEAQILKISSFGTILVASLWVQCVYASAPKNWICHWDVLIRKPSHSPRPIKQKSLQKLAPIRKVDKFQGKDKGYKPKKKKVKNYQLNNILKWLKRIWVTWLL